MEVDDSFESEARVELDSHANMLVFGRHCKVIADSGRKAEVNAFAPDIQPMRQVPIVDAAIAYDCPYSLKTYILVGRNGLYVDSMDNTLVPPFVMREAGIEVNDTPKIHAKDPSVVDHSIFFKTNALRIPLSLWGIFSYFPSRIPTDEELDSCDKIMFTPDSPDWNPHSDVYARNEENHLDWRGEMVEPQHRKRVLFDEPEAGALQTSYTTQSSYCDPSLVLTDVPSTPWEKAPLVEDQVNTSLANISTALHPEAFVSSLTARGILSDFGMSVGSLVGALDDSEDLYLNLDEQPMVEVDMVDGEIFAAEANNIRGVTPVELSKVWKIDIQSAKDTLKVTSQRRKIDGNSNLSRNLSTNDRMLRYRRIKSYFFTDTFFVTSRGKSKRGNTCMQLFVSDKGFVFVFPMRARSEFKTALQVFAKEVGAPKALIVDPAGEQTSYDVRHFCHQIGTTLCVLEEHTQWANKAELYIGLLKEGIRKDMRESHCPLVLWDYCAERRALIHNLTVKPNIQLQGLNPIGATLGDEGDISNVCNFGWYEWCYYRDQKNLFPFPKEYLGRVLGPATNTGNEMAQWILKSNGQVVARRTVRKLKPEEIHNNTVEEQKRQLFDSMIQKKLGDSISPPPAPLKPEETEFIPYEDDEVGPITMPESDPVDASTQAVGEQPWYDRLIHAELNLPQGENMVNAKVLGRSRDTNGNIIGTYDNNPMLNTVIYDVEFPDGAVKQYAANTIAENMYAQVDSEGFQYTLLDSITDYATDKRAISKANKYFVTKQGTRRLRHTTAGWKLLVLWKDGSEQWVPLKDLKNSHPIEVAEFAKSRGIDDEAAFCWWVPYVLKKRNRCIAAANARVKKATHKYGIEIPTSIEHAKRIDEKNGNTYWQDAIKKEMYNVSIAFEILDHDEPVPPGWTPSSGHIIFDVKMDFTRKARWVKDGHKTADPDWSTYAGFVSRDSVRIAFTYAALNGLDICAADIKNAYLQAPASEKHYITCGAEFGLENVGKKALIRRALYGGKSAGADFWKHLRSCMEFLNFQSCKADPDVWMRPATKSDGSSYWEYVLLYCDDTLVISEHGEDILRKEIGKYFELKEESIGKPSIYLGGKVSQVTLENGVQAWSFSSSQYVQAAVKNVESYLKERNMSLPKRASSPFGTNYRPEVDVSPELNDVDAAYYMSLIGVLRWMVELGRVDICIETSLMSSHMALPRKGHLEQLYHMFAYLKAHHNSEMVFDPSDVAIDLTKFEKQDWSSSVYGTDLKEELPSNMPESRGQGFTMTAYVDSDHAGDTVTRRSRTGFLVYLNNSPIHWYSKKQTGIETSSFGSEFLAMKHCTEYIRGLRYKLRMMGIAISGPTYIYGDNQSVLANTSKPESVLKKKSNSIAYHFVREGCARDEWRTTYVNTNFNPADLLTKPLASGEKRRRFVSMLLHHIYDRV